ncbi:MAG: SMP-30/gluconolactonase/LRE family protein [Deltaproteobacteria bacterium]|nr:SMP-30/gluconolactonase/LRE family protein [Deltaproteobacteria bacterium]
MTSIELARGVMRDWWFPARFATAIFLLMVAVVAGCSRRGQSMPGQYLYATVPETGLIVVYPVSASGAAQPLATIRESPPDKPIDVSVDSSGEVFVANENGNIRAYGGRNFHYELIHTLEGPHTQIQHPTAIVVKSDGTFYVADAGSAGHRPLVEWFPAGQNGNVFPNRVITGPHTGIISPRGLALDGSGRLFVSDQATNKVLVFGPDATGDEAPLLAIDGLDSPAHLFVDQLLNIYVCNRRGNSIAIFMTTGPQSWSRSGTITSVKMRQPAGVAADQSGHVAVATIGEILFFPPNSDGQIEPVSELQGRIPMNPAGIFVH